MDVRKNLLVTGGAGFIGSNFIRFVKKNEPNWKIINLDLLTYAGNLENLEDIGVNNYHFFKGDICDTDLISDLIKNFQIDTIVNFAAETHVDRSIRNPNPFIRTNIFGTYNLIETARNIWQSLKGDLERKFLQISTDEVYGSLNNEDLPFTENSKYSPNSPYAASKASSDHLVRAYHHTYNLPINITNCSNNFGPYQHPEKLIPYTILNALRGKKIGLYGDGKQIRNWLFVEDHCEAILEVLKSGSVGETYNIGGDNQITNLDIVTLICRKLDQYLPKSNSVPHEKLITFIKDRLGHDFRYDIDSSKIKRDLCWKPKHSLDNALSKTIEWYLKKYRIFKT